MNPSRNQAFIRKPTRAAAPQQNMSWEMCNMANITHVIINAGYGGIINAQIEAICNKISEISGEPVTCLFSYDNRNATRPMYVPHMKPHKLQHAQEVVDCVGAKFMNNPICFEMKSVMYMFFAQLAILQCVNGGDDNCSYDPSHISVSRADANSEGVLVLTYNVSVGTEPE
jgi:hypothetical protein